jgi:dolichol-phosphate mannosyltransferase
VDVIERPAPPDEPVEISVVVPVYDEEGAAADLAREIAAAFGAYRHEIVFVDDASRDATVARLVEARSDLPQLRLLRHLTNAGQSRAIRTGVLAARAPLVVTLDGDGQNDPADGPRLVRLLSASPDRTGMIAGRRARRQDSMAKRWGSQFANGLRRRLLRDGADDTGCGLKAMRREAFLRLPYFDHMHRFLPALMLREGYQVLFEDVGHRARMSGRSKYSNFGRLKASVADLAGVLWLASRSRRPGEVQEL